MPHPPDMRGAPASPPPGPPTARLERGELITRVRRSPPGVDLQALLRCSPEAMFGLLTDYGELPRHIAGLEAAEVVSPSDGDVSVRFTMKLPFPVGRITWTNRIHCRQTGDAWMIEWTLTGGDLRANEGRLVMTPHRGDPDVTYAHYRVTVEPRSRLPKSAQRLATRWLLPRIVGQLRRAAEML